MSRKPISESKLIIPALAVLSQQEDLISTRTLKKGILKLIKPKKADLQNVSTREQTIIDSRIDNLISHRTLEEYATYKNVDGKFLIKINKKGRTHLSKAILGIEA